MINLEVEKSLSEQLNEALASVLNAIVFVREAASPLEEMPLSQLRCLHVVVCNEGLKTHELADALGIKLPAVSQLVDRLVRRGMMDRRGDHADRRVVRLHATQMGRDLMTESRAARDARLSDAVSRLTDHQAAQAVTALTALARAAESTPTNQPAPTDANSVDQLFASRSRAAHGQ